MKKIDKSKTKKDNKTYSTDEMKRYLGSIKEHIDDRFKSVMEGVSGINQRLDIVQSDVEVIKNNLN